jgi:hypothetical protein
MALCNVIHSPAKCLLGMKATVSGCLKRDVSAAVNIDVEMICARNCHQCGKANKGLVGS